jgi:hypothetical protein
MPALRMSPQAYIGLLSEDDLAVGRAMVTTRAALFVANEELHLFSGG